MEEFKLLVGESFEEDSEVIWNALQSLVKQFRRENLDTHAVVATLLLHAMTVTYELSISSEDATKLIDKLRNELNPEIIH